MDYERIGGALVGLAAGAGGGLLLLWAKVSSTRFNATGDRAGMDMITRLEKENERLALEAKENRDYRLEAVVKIAEQDAEIKLLSHEIDNLKQVQTMLKEQMARMQRTIESLTGRQDKLDDFGGAN
jgi:chromosome segregation ATPase